MKQIITSLLDTDMYKFSMGQVIYHQFSEYTTTWTFKNRSNAFFTKEMVKEIIRQIKLFCNLSFQEDELNYLKSITWMKDSYIDFLRLWHPRFEDFIISTASTCGLVIEAKGSWLNTSMYEVPVLAIVNEVYYYYMENKKSNIINSSFKAKLKTKEIDLQKTYNIPCFSEFGTRRRLSKEMQELVIQTFKDYPEFVGTSNVYFAWKYGLKPMGTMAHELCMCIGQGNHKHNPAYSNWYTLEAWVKEYGILNGIALTDTIGTDIFLKDFQLTYATLFSGVRHDSGDPIEWGEKMIKHYQDLGIDPMTKTLLFSDNLSFSKATKIANRFEGRAKVAFGIGTYLTNDTYRPPLNIVMKVTSCNESPVAKISDTNGKNMCKDYKYNDYLISTIKWRLNNN